jgi:hypothetical protein
MSNNLKSWKFENDASGGLFIAAGGFEDRALTFLKKTQKTRFHFQRVLLLQYSHKQRLNSLNYRKLVSHAERLTRSSPLSIQFYPDKPIASSLKVGEFISKLAYQIQDRSVWIDISSMTHLMALSTIHACLSHGLRTTVVYTEAKSYFPSEQKKAELEKAWKGRNYEAAARLLQSAGLKEIQIGPDFTGNFRSGARACLIIFAGFEPNRVQGLVDIYAPGAIIVVYGISPHKKFAWRTVLSRSLHEDIFGQWLTRSMEMSTFHVNDIVQALENEFNIIRGDFDVAIAPQGSKMQALASYLFWRRHPEVQLLFTSPVRFNPDIYSKGAGETFTYEIA